MPITGPLTAGVDTVAALLHWPPGGRTLAWTVGAVPGPPSHTATARPSGAIATAGLTPWARVTGPDQVCPSALVQACTFCWYPAAACASAALTATDPPHAPGSCTGGDHEPAACAGTATAALAPSAISKAGSATAPRGMNRDMARPSLPVVRVHGFLRRQTRAPGS